ncbi:hypothetical protein CFN78_25325 [Amycolatopsis antarctica]|uniref:Uncharacterized protein n=1 Tax=Amycolatopsis antarctica TaxID=1854586 RepID=A0A263CWH2_9PSEU|nr:hypothetical protein [Amycolatopsis antarctica]OZM70482.1 hypothetical protein CFN78_25325 [Amycolatopsis antarctica]
MFGHPDLDRLLDAWRQDIDSVPFPVMRVPEELRAAPGPAGSELPVQRRGGETPGDRTNDCPSFTAWQPPLNA